MVEAVEFDLRKIDECSSLTSFVLGSLAEAASVVLEQLHPAVEQRVGCALELDEHTKAEGPLCWSAPTLQARATHANENNASEDGAVAVAIVAVHRSLGYRVVARAEHRSGADYLMWDPTKGEDELVRLEVSGIIGVASARSRLRVKVEELENGRDRRPGVACVVRFSTKPVMIYCATVKDAPK
jgi:hypothetical protein